MWKQNEQRCKVENSIAFYIREAHLVRSQPPETSSSNNSHGHQRIIHNYIELLPEIVLGKIISFLHWKEKEWFLGAFPQLKHIMNSPLAWEHFENDRAYALENLYMYIYFPQMVSLEKDVIRKFGKYFQSCTIWLHKLSTVDEKKDDDFSLLTAVSIYCTHLKCIHVVHPSDLSEYQLRKGNEYFLEPLKKVAQRTDEYQPLKLSISRLFYTAMDSVDSGILAYISRLVQNNLTLNLVCLDFSHGLINDDKFRVVNELKLFVNLKTLKCPIQSVSTQLIIEMCKSNLYHLYLVSDDHTYEMDYSEQCSLDWESIERSVSVGGNFEVHYIYRNRALSRDDLVFNPFTRSLIFDNLSSNIPAYFLYKIADLYGSTIRTLAFCSNYWEFLMHFTDLEKIDNSFKYIAQKCLKLTAFLSCLTLPSMALVTLAENSSSLVTLRVFKENVILSGTDLHAMKFTQTIRNSLGDSLWSMVKKGNNIYNIPGVDCRLLFARCYKEV